MLVLDACVWIAQLHVTDSQHEKAKKVFDEIDDLILLPEYILVEVLNVLTKKAGKKKADKFLGKILVADGVELGFSSRNFLFSTIQIFLDSERGKLSFVDQSLLYLSQFHKVITFDRNLNKALTTQGKK